MRRAYYWLDHYTPCIEHESIQRVEHRHKDQMIIDAVHRCAGCRTLTRDALAAYAREIAPTTKTIPGAPAFRLPSPLPKRLRHAVVEGR